MALGIVWFKAVFRAKKTTDLFFYNFLIKWIDKRPHLILINTIFRLKKQNVNKFWKGFFFLSSLKSGTKRLGCTFASILIFNEKKDDRHVH